MINALAQYQVGRAIWKPLHQPRRGLIHYQLRDFCGMMLLSRLVTKEKTDFLAKNL